jgi:hypothetical protein
MHPAVRNLVEMAWSWFCRLWTHRSSIQRHLSVVDFLHSYLWLLKKMKPLLPSPSFSLFFLLLRQFCYMWVISNQTCPSISVFIKFLLIILFNSSSFFLQHDIFLNLLIPSSSQSSFWALSFCFHVQNVL